MVCFEHLAFSQIHVHAARQTRIEAANGPHNIDALEFVAPVLFEDRRVLNGIFVRARCPVDVPRLPFQGVGG